jgi:hypothetical protein
LISIFHSLFSNLELLCHYALLHRSKDDEERKSSKCGGTQLGRYLSLMIELQHAVNALGRAI